MARVHVKILEISGYPPPRAGWGVRVSFVRRHLEAAGHDCRVLNVGRSRKIRSQEYLDVQGPWDYLRKVVWHVRRGYLLHTHVNGDSPKGLLLALAAELATVLYGRRCVLTFHAGPEQRFFPKHRSRLMAPFYRLLFLLARSVICNSRAVKDRIVSYGLPPEKVVPIPAFSRQYLEDLGGVLPAALEEFMGGRRRIVASYFFYRPEFFVEPLIQAVATLAQTLPDLRLLLIGADTRSDAVARLIERAQLRDRVLLAGDLSHEQFLGVISRVHVFIRTPKKDGVCSSVLEALSLGVPVVAAENGARPPGVVTYQAGDTADLVQKLLYVLDNYDVVRSGLSRPQIEDTVAKEADLLVRLAS